MTPDEHLDCILTFCRTALTACEQRTPGEWIAKDDTLHGAWIVRANRFYVCATKTLTELGGTSAIGEPDARFIASASIGYEAALRSTIAAIEGFRAFTGHLTPTVERNFAYAQLTAIRSAWPQLLK